LSAGGAGQVDNLKNVESCYNIIISVLHVSKTRYFFQCMILVMTNSKGYILYAD